MKYNQYGPILAQLVQTFFHQPFTQRNNSHNDSNSITHIDYHDGDRKKKNNSDDDDDDDDDKQRKKNKRKNKDYRDDNNSKNRKKGNYRRYDDTLPVAD